MYVGIDVGGTKTLVAVLDDNGVIQEKQQFATPKEYSNFLKEISSTLDKFDTKHFEAGAVGIPAVLIDREHGRGMAFSNLTWRNVAIQHDLEQLCGCPIVVENDAKLAALSEAMLLKDEFERVLYVTVSTGIGFGLVVKQKIDTNIGDGGGRTILLDHKGKLTPWEDFASGRAIVERYGLRAEEIDDQAIWQAICRDLAKGFRHLIALAEPEVLVIGGSVGQYFDRYSKLLEAELKRHPLPIITLPKLRPAGRPTEAVVYGCYDIVKQVYPHAAVTN